VSQTAEVMNITTKTTKAELEAEVRRLATLANDNHNELQSFQKRVYEVALEQKVENDWCDEGFAEAMESLGLKAPAKYRLVTITAPVDLLDPKGPLGYDLEDIEQATDDEIAEAVLEALNVSSYGNPRYEGHTVKVEVLDEKPETLLQEKPRSSWGSSY
jgi:hypothetical protein